MAPAMRRTASGSADALEWFVRLAFDNSPDTHRLRDRIAGLRAPNGPDGLFPRILQDAMEITDAGLGTVQVLDPWDGLRIVATSGFGSAFLDHFAVVDDAAACGRAARRAEQTVIADTEADPGFAPHRKIAAASGFRSVQSTPLTDHAGRLVGVVSTHFADPGAPPREVLDLMVAYGRLAGEAVSVRVHGPAGVPGPALADDPRDGPPTAGPTPDAADLAVRRLFAAGMDLHAARRLLGPGTAERLIADATAELDQAVGEIRLAVFEQDHPRTRE